MKIVAAICILALLLSGGNSSRENLPLSKDRSLTGIARETDEPAGGEDEQFRKWYEEMHRAAPGVDWRKADAETRRNKYAVRQGNLSNGRMATFENLANGNLTGQWAERGSANKAGRIWVADLDTSTGSVYCGSDGGNIWKGDLNGNNWSVLNDKLKFDVRMLRVLPNGTGKRIFVAGEVSVHYSDDDGATWQSSAGLNTALATTSTIKRALVLDDSLRTIYLLLDENDIASSSIVNSIYKSVDKGASFTRIHSYSQSTYGALPRFDIWAPPYGNSNLYFLRYNSLFSIDRVTNAVTLISSTLSSSSFGARLLAGYKDQSLFVFYAYIGTQLFRSADGGLSWGPAVNVNITPFATMSFSCSCVNPDHVYLGDINCHYSTDGGQTWNLVNSWTAYYSSPATNLHGDITSVISLCDAQQNEFQFIGTDGGLFISHNNLQSVQNLSLNHLDVSQYYSVYTNKNNPNYIFAGAQDQGFQRCLVDSGNVLGFEQAATGDFGHIVSTDGISLWMNYPGYTIYYTNATITASSGIWNFPSSMHFWMPPLMADRTANNIAYIAGGNINSTGSHIIQLTYNSIITASELPYDFKSASGGGYVSAMATSPLNTNYWYVLTDNGKFFHSSDHGVTWSMTNVTGLSANYLYGATIYPSQTTAGVLYVGGSGYSNSPAYRSTDGGQSFTAISAGLPNTMIFELTGNFNDSLIFAATEVGPYVYVVSENTWYDMEGVAAPDQTYWTVEYIPAINTVRFGTYGRGIWDFGVSSPSPTGVLENTTQQDIRLFPNPAVGSFTIQLNDAGGGKAELLLCDLQGKILRAESLVLLPGETSIPVSCADLAPGAYLVRVRTENENYTKRVLVNSN